MRRLFFGIFILPFLLYADQSLSQIEQDIGLSQQKKQRKEDEKNRLTTMLQKLGNEINQKNRQLRRLDTEINLLQDLINSNQDKSQMQEKTLAQYQKLLNSLKQKKQEIKDNITKILVNDLGFVMVLNERNPISPDDIVLQEVFKVLSKKSQEKFTLLTQEEALINGKITDTLEVITTLDKDITTQKNKRDNLQSMKDMQKKLIVNLQKDLQKYNQKLKQNNQERKSLDEILKRLDIVKTSKEKEILEQQRKEELQEKEEMAKKPITPSNIPSFTNPIEVKQVANSYQQLSVAKYRGGRTISPIESYDIEQKFGNYFDPVYKLKVFNEAVILLSKTPNSPVRSIFDGKVVYAKEVPILKKVVIIENQNGIHTIYSQLDKIAPTIKVGFTVKKGYVIGRVEQKLSFEITQKDKYIDPLDVIAKSK